MKYNRLIFRVHVLQRMFQRQINEEDIRHVLESGEVIEEYPKDLPYPSCLILGFISLRPLHVVIAENKMGQETIVITAYEPDVQRWELGFKRRKKL